MKSLKFTILSVALGVCVPNLWSADQTDKQQQQQAGQAAQGNQAGQRGRAMNADQKLASCIAIANQEEIAIARMAEEKLHNREIKEFAKMLVEDHQAFLKKLSQYAPEAAHENSLNELTEHAGKDGSRQSESGKSTSSNSTNNSNGANSTSSQTNRDANVRQAASSNEGDGGHLDMVQLHREIAAECIRAAKKEMADKDGDEFDQCFITSQIVKHGDMKTKLTVFERHASGDLKQVIAQGISTTEQHKSKAETLAKQLESGQSQTRRESKSTSKQE